MIRVQNIWGRSSFYPTFLHVCLGDNFVEVVAFLGKMLYCVSSPYNIFVYGCSRVEAVLAFAC